MTQFNKNFKQRVVSIVTLFALFLALNASGALAGFWRTVNDTFTNMTWWDEVNFSYGYGYGDGGWWYGYGYGYGYQNTFGYGYGAYSNSSNISEVLTALKSSFNSNGELLQTFTLPFTSFSVELPQGLRITDTNNDPIDVNTLTWYVLSTNPTITGFTPRWTVKFGIPGTSLHFSKAVKVEIPVSTSLNNTSVSIRVSHNGGAYGTTGLALSDTTCTNGAPNSNAWSSATVVAGKATIYTCSASEFAAVTATETPSWGWGWTYTPPKTQTGTTSTETPVVDTPAETTDVVTDDTYTTETSDDGKVTITKADGTKVVLSDINTSFAKAYIEKLAALGIINGYEDGTFKPENKASRAEYLKIVLRAMNIDYSDVDTSKLTFADVDKNSWIAKVVVKAAELNMIDTTNKNFRPNASISRAESMKMLLNAAGIETSENTVSDFSDVKGWAVKYVQKAKDLGIVNGQEINGKILFRPADNITRAEVSKIVVKTMELK